jgi:hypothetical protein
VDPCHLFTNVVVWLTAKDEEVSDSCVNEFESVPQIVTLPPVEPKILNPAVPQIVVLADSFVENEDCVEVLVPIIVVSVY